MFAVRISLTLNHSPSTRVSYFAVFDGHGGIRASKFAAQNLHQNLIRKFPKGERNKSVHVHLGVCCLCDSLRCRLAFTKIMTIKRAELSPARCLSD